MTSEFGNVSDDYAKYRNALPQVLFNQLIDQGVFFAGNQIIELGSGTGIISRDLAMLGAHVIGIEPSPQDDRAS
ncbi:class I SAM-dependent methyltransferase [Paenibacillus terrigena]|uniref:class I SAM-dependent methyltransferase n=1 Tax=Paenibacillus terrigena TaxID=369333 RepID=UPI0028D05744|nr:class I SAM-dependent methyltransferase [Paenibacillus terrigena]